MFGLTRREQRWKAEQQAAELIVNLACIAIQSEAQVRQAEAVAKAQADALEIEKLRLQIAELERVVAESKKEV